MLPNLKDEDEVLEIGRDVGGGHKVGQHIKDYKPFCFAFPGPSAQGNHEWTLRIVCVIPTPPPK